MNQLLVTQCTVEESAKQRRLVHNRIAFDFQPPSYLFLISHAHILLLRQAMRTYYLLCYTSQRILVHIFLKKKKWGNHLNIRLILYKPTGGFYKGHGWAHVLVVNMRVTYYREEFPKAHTQEAHTCGLGPLRRANTQQLTLEYVSKREERRGPPPRKQREKSQEAEAGRRQRCPEHSWGSAIQQNRWKGWKTKNPMQPCKTRVHYRKRKQKQPLGPDSSEERMVFKSYKDL